MTTINSPFRYAGGKFYARNLILRCITSHKHYCEPLAGGASIFFAKEKVETNWLNDLDDELVNCLIHIRDAPKALSDFLKNKKPSKELHHYYKNIYKPKNDMERAGRWYLLNRMSYSGIMKMENCYWGYGDKFSMQPKNWGKHIERCSKKLQGVKLTCRDFETVIDQVPDHAFLFVDPPYYNRDQDKFYTRTFGSGDHERLMRALQRNTNRIRFLLTYDDCEEIERMYTWATEISTQQWWYTINRTDDQTGRTNNKGKRRKGKELFIMNYRPPQLEIKSLV